MLRFVTFNIIAVLLLAGMSLAQTVTVTSATRTTSNGPIDIKLTLTGDVTLDAFEFKDANNGDLEDDDTCEGGGSTSGTVYLTYTVTNPPAGAVKVRVRFNGNGRSPIWVTIALPLY